MAMSTRFGTAILHILKGPHGIDNRATDIGFGNEERICGNFTGPSIARRNDDVNWWPSVSHASKLTSIRPSSPAC